MASPFINFLVSVGPIIGFVVLMIIVYMRGSRINKELLKDLETKLTKSIDPYTKEIRKVEIRPGEYEFRCKAANKNISILTVHLKLVNRTFIIQWLINLFYKGKERIFMGVKIGGEYGSEDPVYKFDLVPYQNKSFIKRRHETYVKYDDIPTADKRIDNKYMIKSQDAAFVQHIVDNPEFIRLLFEVEPYLEHLGIDKAKEETDPHIAATFEFYGEEEQPVDIFAKLFFLVVNQHIQHHDDVKKIRAKGRRGRAKARRRGSARRGGATGRRKRKRKK